MPDGWARLRRRLWPIGQLVVVSGVIAAAVYWTQFAPATVTAFTVQRGEVVAEVMGTGTLEPRISAAISPKISGLITAVLVDQGDRAEVGQILVQLDDRDLSQQVEVAESALGAANAAVERQKADRARALAVLDQARFDYERIEDLAKQNTAATTEFQEATKALRVAEADVARADAALTEAQKHAVTAERTLELQKARLADTVIRAPFPGLIARRDRDPGDVVVPGSSVLLLASTDELWISAWVDETEMARLRPDQPARIVFRAEPGRSYVGRVARLGREVDRETREFLVDVRVRELPQNWAVGQRAEAYIEAGRNADAVCVPTRLVVWRDGQPGTLVQESGRAVWRRLELGLRGREFVEVLAGLAAGDQVVAPANLQAGELKPGQRVVVRPTQPAAPAEARP